MKQSERLILHILLNQALNSTDNVTAKKSYDLAIKANVMEQEPEMVYLEVFDPETHSG